MPFELVTLDRRVIVKNPRGRVLPDWIYPVRCFQDRGDCFCYYGIGSGSFSEAIAVLTGSGYEVWALEHRNGGEVQWRVRPEDLRSPENIAKHLPHSDLAEL